jgi:hypothetical protein
MSNYKLYTSGPYKQNNGSAITATSTDINLGVAKKVQDGVVLSKVDNLTGAPSFPNVKGGVKGVGFADYGTTLTVATTGVAQNNATNDLVQLTFTGVHGLSVGNTIGFTTNTTGAQFREVFYRVMGIVSTSGITINMEHNAGLNSLTPTVKVVNGTFAVQGDENFVMMKNDATVHGQANSKLAYGASDYGRRKVAKFDETLNTVRVATAIRNDKYDPYTGDFDTNFPVDTTDTLNTDDETVDSTTKIGTKGELTFRSGGANPTSADYRAKTN